MSVTIAYVSTQGYVPVSIVDLATGKDMLSAPAGMAMFEDNGGLYNYGYEDRSCGPFEMRPSTAEKVAPRITERGPLRASLNVTFALTGQPSWRESYEVIYSLVAGEPFLRITIIGAVPTFNSLFMRIPFASKVYKMGFGTPYHWDVKKPWKFGPGTFNAVMEATHNFVIPYDNQMTPLGAVYHGGIPSWGINLPEGVLYGNLARNTLGSCENKGATGQDIDVHISKLAIRVPTGMPIVESGSILQEALSYNTPLTAVYADPKTNKRISSPQSIVSSDNPLAIVTAAKEGDNSGHIVRLYQASNGPVKTSISLNADIWPNVETSEVSAVERPLSSPSVNVVSGKDVTMTRSIVTVQIKA